MKAIILLGLLLTTGHTLLAGTNKNCSHEFTLSYCYYPGEAQEVVYYFHGFTGNQRSWDFAPMPQDIEQNWEANSTKRPHIITISFGSQWWFDNDYFRSIDYFFSWAPENILEFEPLKTSIYGNSMGGYNALRFYSRTRHKIDRLALSCPATPSSLSEKGETSFDGNPLLSFLANDTIYMENDDDWTVESGLNIDTETKFYIGSTPTDAYGFYRGNINLYEVIKDMGADITLDEQSADHCDLESSALAEFLVI